MCLTSVPWLLGAACMGTAVWGVCDGFVTLNESGSSTRADILISDFQQ